MRPSHTSKLFLAIGALALTAVAGWAVAQETERSDQDKAEIHRQAGDVARGYLDDRRDRGDAPINVSEIMAQAERFSDEAREMRDRMTEHLASVENDGGSFFDEGGAIDASALASAAGDIARASRDEGGAKPLFVTFVSLSMPDAALTSIIRDTKKAGGVVVVRGFYGGSYGAFANRVRELFEEGDDVGISVDPRYFQALGIKTVPTYAVIMGEPVCDGFVCDPIRGDTLTGNISVAAALQLISDHGSLAPMQAKAALKRLEPDL